MSWHYRNCSVIVLIIHRFGPNTFPAHNSVIYTTEVQVEYAAKTLFAPIIDHCAKVIEVKEEAEQNFVEQVEKKLAGSVFSAGCSNWYINPEGRNSASWPGKAANLWYATIFPVWKDYQLNGGEASWIVRRVYRKVKQALLSNYVLIAVLTAGLFFSMNQYIAPMYQPLALKLKQLSW